nr:immunoglobulin light chain junction region [Macaca mulatta]MOV75971.1 immunoglobulin light chain junction region [Macaca mulatta]
CLQRSNWYSF